MKRCLITVLFLIYTLILTSIYALAEEKEIVTMPYTPSTQMEARCIPLNLQHQQWNQGEVIKSGCTTLYNPYTAEMMVELAKASRQIGKDTEWGKVITTCPIRVYSVASLV